MRTLDLAELKNKTVFLSLIRQDGSHQSLDLYQKRTAELFDFLHRVIARERGGQTNAHH